MSNKTKTNNKTINNKTNTKPLTNSLPVKPAPDDSQEQDKDLELINQLTQCNSWYQAALNVGYSPSYAKLIRYKKLRSNNFISKLKQYYNNSTTGLLPKILAAESKIVDLVLENPENISKFRHTLKEIKQSAGVLAYEERGQAPVINIGQIQALIRQEHETQSE